MRNRVTTTYPGRARSPRNILTISGMCRPEIGMPLGNCRLRAKSHSMRRTRRILHLRREICRHLLPILHVVRKQTSRREQRRTSRVRPRSGAYTPSLHVEDANTKVEESARICANSSNWSNLKAGCARRAPAGPHVRSLGTYPACPNRSLRCIPRATSPSTT